jgi:mRNA degradation ribonuclease J1/J2
MKALMIKTRKGNVLHTGDWKFDPNPVVGEVSEIEKIKEYGDKGEILAMICDSTNAINEGHSRSEGELHESLKSLIIGRNSYVGVTTFASNIARIHTIASIAKEVGRKIVLAGYSLHRLYEVGKKSGYFFENFEFISDREIKFYNKKEILIISTLIIHILLIALITGVNSKANTHLDINDASLLESYGSNVYVVDLSKNDNLKRAFILTCSSGPNVLDLNLTFTGLRSRIEKVK